MSSPSFSAETFCDIERTAGTCYKEAGWIPLGRTQGFTRVNRQDCDFYVPNDRPKAVCVKPLGKESYESLYDALCHVRDTRDSNRTFPIGGCSPSSSWR